MGKIISTMPNKIFSTFHSDSFYFMNDIFIISLTTNGNEWHSISYFWNGNTNGFLLSIKSNQILYILLHDLQETNSWIISHNSINWTSSQIQQNIISEIWANRGAFLLLENGWFSSIFPWNSGNRFIISRILNIRSPVLDIQVVRIRNLEVDECPSKENLFGQSALLMDATYIVFCLRWSINSWNNNCIRN